MSVHVAVCSNISFLRLNKMLLYEYITFCLFICWWWWVISTFLMNNSVMKPFRLLLILLQYYFSSGHLHFPSIHVLYRILTLLVQPSILFIPYLGYKKPYRKSYTTVWWNQSAELHIPGILDTNDFFYKIQSGLFCYL